MPLLELLLPAAGFFLLRVPFGCMQRRTHAVCALICTCSAAAYAPAPLAYFTNSARTSLRRAAVEAKRPMRATPSSSRLRLAAGGAGLVASVAEEASQHVQHAPIRRCPLRWKTPPLLEQAAAAMGQLGLSLHLPVRAYIQL